MGRRPASRRPLAGRPFGSVAALGAGLLLASCGTVPFLDPDPPVGARLTRGDVEAIVLRHLAVMGQVGHCAAIPAHVVSMAFAGGQWQIRAEGTFATDRGRRVQPLCAATGQLTILDADGSIIGMGLP